MLPDTLLITFYVNLTHRKRQVLQLVSTGITNRETAEKLFIQPSVVADHLTEIFQELETVEGISGRFPANRITLARLYGTGFFDRYPYLNSL